MCAMEYKRVNLQRVSVQSGKGGDKTFHVQQGFVHKDKTLS